MFIVYANLQATIAEWRAKNYLWHDKQLFPEDLEPE